jgi:BlaI family penicillinase repressor
MAEAPQPTESELEILAELWRRGQATVREVHEAMAADRGTGYTTTLKLMQIMAAKGLVLRDESERSHVYRAAQPPAAAQQQIVGRLIDRVFAGSASALVQQALEAGTVDAAELREIRRMLDDHATRTRLGRGKP